MADYSRPSDYPVSKPLLTHLLVDQIHEENVAAGRRPKAAKTTFRASDAGRCARAMAYDSLGYEVSDEPDPASEHVMWLGSLIGEKFAEAVERKYPGAQAEVQIRHGDLVSGHVDVAVRHPEMGNIVYELKTKGSFAFDKAIGLRRKEYRQEHPEGPGLARLQGALYATALNADLLVIGVIAMEAVSRQLAARIGFDDYSRIMAEWHYTPAEFGPWADMELGRMEGIKECIEAEVLPPRQARGDDFEMITLDPTSSRLDFRCTYCNFRTQCTKDALNGN